MHTINPKKNPIHLGLGATSIVQPDFSGTPSWYQDYAKRTEADGAEGRLVAIHTFSDSWTSWECHPEGSEVVLCIAGVLTLHQELDDGTVRSVRLDPGQCAINKAGTWHTADVAEPATVLFITAGQGTQHRPR